jgi:UDP-glucose 4-epimerase
VLLASSSEVYGDGPVPFVESEAVRPGATEAARGGYACAKAMGEWLAFGHAAQDGLATVVARLFNTVGPRQSFESGMVLPRFVAQAVAGLPITVYGDGSQTRCFAHVRDVARALADLAGAAGIAGRVCNVGSDREVSVRTLAELVRGEVGGGSIEFRSWQSVFPEGFVDPPRRVPSLARLREAIGWVPATPIEAIVRELVALARADVGAAAAAMRG